MLLLSPHLSSLHPAVELLADIVQNCSLEDSQIEKERDVILQELQENDTSMRDVVFNDLHAPAFQGTPLAQSVEGPSENVRCELAGPGAGRPLIGAWAGHSRRSLHLLGRVPVLFIFLIHTTGDLFCVATCSPGVFLNVCVVPTQIAGFVSMCVSCQPEGGCSGGPSTWLLVLW